MEQNNNTRRVISLLVDNSNGVLARISSLLCRRGFNIDSLTVSATNDPAVSRITVTLRGTEQALNQLILQTERLEVTRQIFELDPDKSLQRELLLLKVECDNQNRAELREISSIYKAKIIDLSPFHTSMFITNLASIKTSYIHHHCYEFGTTSVFVCMGKPVPDYMGGDLTRKVMPIGVVMDERICTGYEYAAFYSDFKGYLRDLSQLETPFDGSRPQKEEKIPAGVS